MFYVKVFTTAWKSKSLTFMNLPQANKAPFQTRIKTQSSQIFYKGDISVRDDENKIFGIRKFMPRWFYEKPSKVGASKFRFLQSECPFRLEKSYWVVTRLYCGRTNRHRVEAQKSYSRDLNPQQHPKHSRAPKQTCWENATVSKPLKVQRYLEKTYLRVDYLELGIVDDNDVVQTRPRVSQQTQQRSGLCWWASPTGK